MQKAGFNRVTRTVGWFGLIVASVGSSMVQSPAQTMARAQEPPKTWVDKDTGHRVTRITDEPNSSALYFNFDAYTPDSREMVYTSPAGIHMLELSSGRTRLLVPAAARDVPAPGPARGGERVIGVGRKTGAVYFSRMSPQGLVVVYSAEPRSGAVRELVTLPKGATVVTINADESLASGTYVEGDHAAEEYGNNRPQPAAPGGGSPQGRMSNGNPQGSLVQPDGKGQMMARRLAAHLPMVLFVIDLHTGKLRPLLHSAEWINHMMFSPTDPNLLMYCHEGPWQMVDRIWLIHADGSGNTLVHKRTMFMEITGHEFWSRDGKWIWYDWQFPKATVYFLAGYEIASGHRVAYNMTPNQWSIHFNGSNDPAVFAGDGGDSGQVTQAPDGTWIELYHTETPGRRDGVNSPDLIQPGVLASEHLVSMANHNYKLEPNERFSPDDQRIFFTSNMFGPSYVFAVEVKKTSDPQASEVMSTSELAQRFSPKPPPTPYKDQW